MKKPKMSTITLHLFKCILYALAETYKIHVSDAWRRVRILHEDFCMEDLDDALADLLKPEEG